MVGEGSGAGKVPGARDRARGQAHLGPQAGAPTSWQPHKPTESDWDQLMYEAGKRVVRRLLSPAQFEEIKRFRK